MAARGNAGYRKRGDSAAASQDDVKPAVGRRIFNKKLRPAVNAKKVVEGIRNSMSGAACCQCAGDARKRTPNLKAALREESSSWGPQTNEIIPKAAARVKTVVAESKRHYVPADALTIQGFETPKTRVEDKP
ncbi:hypothetical protein C8J57DRAFT_1245203 [Mycena rebaudengoi]|nr:hypothetical protein C8J57DRAFT_1245203 [Mycena rebaudengoi]